MVKEENYLCESCKFFTENCEHPFNITIELQKRIEKKIYNEIGKIRKKNCMNYVKR